MCAVIKRRESYVASTARVKTGARSYECTQLHLKSCAPLIFTAAAS